MRTRIVVACILVIGIAMLIAADKTAWWAVPLAFGLFVISGLVLKNKIAKKSVPTIVRTRRDE